MVDLSEHQREIANSILNSRSLRTSLAGLAGTGKTTLAKYVYDEWTKNGISVCAMAPTGKAGMVLRSKGVPASTVHRVVYDFKGKYEADNGDIELIFEGKEGLKISPERFIVDEASMITQKMMDDIEDLGIPTLWVGDPGQLPPVKAKRTNLLSRPTHELREIHRQAKDSPIIKFAYALRQGASLSTRFEGIGRVSVSGKGPLDVAGLMLDRGVNRMITKTNLHRVAINNAVRALAGKKNLVHVGDELICVMNNNYWGVTNGEVLRVLEVQGTGDSYVQCLVTTEHQDRRKIVRLYDRQFGQLKTLDPDEMPDDLVQADYAYAVTCHKFQGSSEKHVGILDKGWCGDDLARWNYTAATRAEDDITVFC